MSDSKSATAAEPVAWLRTQVEADRELAQRAKGRGDGQWHVRHPGCDPSCGEPCARTGQCHNGEHHPHWCRVVEGDSMLIYDEGGHDEGQAEHIARNDPAAVIAACEAKLAILDLCDDTVSHRESPEEDGWEDGRDPDERERDEAVADLAGDVLALIADAYRHRPGWAEHWACPGCGKALRILPDGHSAAISMQNGTWSCTDVAPLSPAEFTGGRGGTS